MRAVAAAESDRCRPYRTKIGQPVAAVLATEAAAGALAPLGRQWRMQRAWAGNKTNIRAGHDADGGDKSFPQATTVGLAAVPTSSACSLVTEMAAAAVTAAAATSAGPAP